MERHLHAHPQIHCIRQNDQVDLQDVSDESDGERLDQSFSLCSLLHTQHVFFFLQAWASICAATGKCRNTKQAGVNQNYGLSTNSHVQCDNRYASFSTQIHVIRQGDPIELHGGGERLDTHTPLTLACYMNISQAGPSTRGW